MKGDIKGYINFYLEENFMSEGMYDTVKESHRGACKSWGPYIVLQLIQVTDSEPELNED